MTYAEWEKKKKDEIEQVYGDSVKLAETELDRKRRQANEDMLRNSVTYGERAEALAQAGLTGSGYSDNLQRDTYATRANALTAADLAYGAALADAESKRVEAEATLADKSMTYQNQLLTNYMTDLESVKAGSIGLYDVEKIATMRGYDGEQKKALTEAARVYYNDYTLPEYKNKVLSGNFTPSEIELAVKDENDLNDLKGLFRSMVDTSSEAFYVNGVPLTTSEAAKYLEDCKKYFDAGWLDEPTWNAINSSYNTLYTPNVVARMDKDKDLWEDGKDFKAVVYDGNDTKVKLESAGLEEDEDVNRIAAAYGSGTVFTYGGKYYVKYQDKVYLVSGRNGEAVPAETGFGSYTGYMSEKSTPPAATTSTPNEEDPGGLTQETNNDVQANEKEEEPSKLGQWWSSTKQWFSDTANSVGKGVGNAANSVGNFFGNAANSVGNAVSGAANFVGNAVSDAAGDVKKAAEGVRDSVSSWFAEQSSRIDRKFDELKKSSAEDMQKQKAELMAELTSFRDQVKKLADSATGSAKAKYEEIVREINGRIKEIEEVTEPKYTRN